MTRDYCTYFDSRYLAKGLALYRSLERVSTSYRLWILCLDDMTYEVLNGFRLPSARLLRLGDLERADVSLLGVKATRSLIEYYFTLTPCLPFHLFKTNSSIDQLTYLDADLYFYSTPEPIFKEIGNKSIGITPHRWTSDRLHMVEFGIYNVGWITFRRDDDGLECLEWYRDRCLEWCYDRPEDGKLADQKYLDDWPERFNNVHVIQHIGANLASWNLGNYTVACNENHYTVDGEPLIFFHFHGLTFKNQSPDLYRLSVDEYYLNDISGCIRRVCEEYLRCVRTIKSELLSWKVWYEAMDEPLRGNKLPDALTH